MASQSNIAVGEHQHYFYSANNTLSVGVGDKLFAYVYLDPANPPSEIMLQWNVGGSWEHRAYWGANNIGWGTDGTASRQFMGALPAAGGWVRLEVPASLVDLEGATVNGMAFTLYGGRATWDQAGKSAAVNASATQVSLSSAFNRAGIVSDGSTFGGGLDNDGYALSANLLGSAVNWNGTTFNLGAANTNNVISAAGQTINLPAGNFSTLNFLAAGVNGNQPNLTFTVTYTDGTTQTFTQSISDWFTPQSYSGESTAVTTAYRNVSNGGQDNRTFNVYGYSFALNGSKTVQSITLPNDGNVEILAMTLR